MAVLDDTIDAFNSAIDQASNDFIDDTKELEEEGLSVEEILLFLSAIDIGTYFIEDLGARNAITAYMAATESLLDDIPFFGATSENQLLALQNMQRSNVVRLTGTIGESVRMSISQGITNKLGKDDIADLIKRNLARDVPRVDTIITSTLGTYQQSVIATMSEDLPDSTLYRYQGPRDNKNRDLCRTFLNDQPLTRAEIEAEQSGAFLDRGGYNCRHLWIPLV
jgi:hypothetical protein|tara:strand:+ start:622 stop:1290 length:669 start_codon:yes stop_codon:yes gene_type:complete